MSLFSPFTIKDVTFKNRIGVSPMCQYSAIDGVANDWHLVNAGSRAVGGAGMVMVEATAVTPEGRISPGDLGLWNDTQQDALRRIATFIEGEGSVPAIQIAHAGRKASADVPWNGGEPLSVEEGGWRPIYGPSAIPFDAHWPVPEALDDARLNRITQAFVDSARWALEAGFKVLEIHAAHGYLLNSFLSPLTNHRTDTYGGSFENRTRLLKEVVQAVQTVWPQNLPLWVRISATDWVEGGWDAEQSVRLAAVLKDLGVDVMDVSTGGMMPDARIPSEAGYQVPFAEQIRKETGMVTAAVGLITEAKRAEAIVQNEQADFVLLARELLRDPYWPLHAAYELGVDVSWPNQYYRAKPRLPQLQRT